MASVRVPTSADAAPLQTPLKPPTQSTKAAPEKAYKIRVFPTREQTKVLLNWLGTVRWTYNRCVQASRDKTCKVNNKELRAAWLNEEALKAKQLEWALETPYDVRDEAMRDVVKAVAANRAAKRERFSLKFRSKKDATQSLVVHSKHWQHKRGVFATIFGAGVLHGHQPLPDVLPYDSRLQRTRLGKWFLCIPQPLEVRSDNQAPPLPNVIALDPGVRTFATGFSPTHGVVEWGKGDISRIYRLCYVMDKLQAQWSQHGVRHKKRYKLQRAARRVRERVRNLVDEAHKKFSKWLCENHHAILLPAFATSQMIRRGQRRIGSKTARAMATWAHFRFRQRLLSKAREYPWCQVVICDEVYTSKSCTGCGAVHSKLGGAKVFKCPTCYFQIDRDENGARNILLRYLTLHCTGSHPIEERMA